MVQLNVSLPEPIYDWVKAQVTAKHFANSSDYVRELIMQVQKHQLLQKAITEGLESGISERLIVDIIKEVTQKKRSESATKLFSSFNFKKSQQLTAHLKTSLTDALIEERREYQ